jgi:outer membrane receptor protein involved in Fe transport
LRWNHLFSDRLFSNTSAIYSNYDYQFGIGVTGFDFKVKAAIDDINLKQDFTFFPNAQNTIKFGLNFINHTFQPTSLDAGEFSSFKDSKTAQRFAYEGGAYAQNDWKISDRFGLQYGVRYSFFDYHGKGTAYTFDENGIKTSEKIYKTWRIHSVLRRSRTPTGAEIPDRRVEFHQRRGVAEYPVYAPAFQCDHRLADRFVGAELQ